VATGADGTVVGGARAELAPVLEEDGAPPVGDVVEGDVVEGDVVEGDDTAVGGLADVTETTEDLAWLGVSWNASAIKAPVDAVAPTTIRRVVALTRSTARSRSPASWR
jgi:hypothetical protein